MKKSKLPIATLLIGSLFTLTAGTILGISTSVYADGTETLGTPSIPIASGTGVRAAGIGLEDSQPGTITITIPDAVTVKQVLLYWGGNNDSHSEFTPTDTIQVESDTVTGNFIGGDTKYPGLSEVTVSYRADITALGLVTAGTST